MNLHTLRSKRVLIPGLGVAGLVAGGVFWASTASADLSGSERDRVAAAATRAAGGATATDVERSDDRGHAYEVQVRQSDGTEVDVDLDENLAVVHQDRDVDDATEATDDRPVTDAERSAATKAALAEIGGGRVTDVEASDDPGEAFEVEVLEADGTDWSVDLAPDYSVLNKHVDD